VVTKPEKCQLIQPPTTIMGTMLVMFPFSMSVIMLGSVMGLGGAVVFLLPTWLKKVYLLPGVYHRQLKWKRFLETIHICQFCFLKKTWFNINVTKKQKKKKLEGLYSRLVRHFLWLKSI